MPKVRAYEGNRLTDRSQLKLRYGHHHQQPQQHSHYDELDPFPTGVREPSQHFVEATQGQPPAINQVIRGRPYSDPISIYTDFGPRRCF